MRHVRQMVLSSLVLALSLLLTVQADVLAAAVSHSAGTGLPRAGISQSDILAKFTPSNGSEPQEPTTESSDPPLDKQLLTALASMFSVCVIVAMLVTLKGGGPMVLLFILAAATGVVAVAAIALLAGIIGGV